MSEKDFYIEAFDNLPALTDNSESMKEMFSHVFYDFLQLQHLYDSAIEVVKTYLNILDNEFGVKFQRNPIHNIESRLKSPQSIIGKLQKKGHDVFYTHIPGANLKFHICYDPVTRLYWLVHSQISGTMAQRRRLALSYSPDLLRWTFAGLVAVGPADNAARHYATMMIHGDDIYIVSRSGDLRAKTAHDNNLTTFHKVKDFRKLVY